MMTAAGRDRVFIADLMPERAGLCEAQMMRVGRGASAYDAGLPGDEFTISLVAQANSLAHDAAAAQANFLLDFRENVDAVCAFDARLRGTDMDGFARRFLRRLVDELRIGVVSRFLSGSRR